MKQAYRVPFERNTDRTKELRRQFVLRIQELDTANEIYEYIYMDEAGFNLVKRRRRARNIIGQRAIVEVPGQRGGNITMCAAMNHHGIVHRHAHLGAYNTDLLLAFLDGLHNLLVPPDHVYDQQRVHFVVIWDNVYERNTQTRVTLLQAMEEACADVSPESCQGFMRHSRRFFQRCLDREDIAVDVDEALWPDRNQRHDGGGV
ncbi:uncharacterized protein LOC133438383 isoform X2 [Cololabis saira]|uniref:uncharacterized protein LOC133438383 isoform X2 n=1 Tax=Cololabis saira TaxID=129043 RepID=UPI002AD5ABC2|nr:uncharacterized protein LOC133438383 isoform X2 [Cololabis saira]